MKTILAVGTLIRTRVLVEQYWMNPGTVTTAGLCTSDLPVQVNSMTTSSLKDQLDSLPLSNWYSLTLDCGKVVYAKVGERITLESNADQLFALCPDCKIKKHRGAMIPTAWRQVTNVKDETDEHVLNVQAGNAFLMPGLIMRLSENPAPNVIPFPYRKRTD